MFKKATKSRVKARIALVGPSGSGKTWTALSIAAGLGDSVAVVDTERGSASLYAGLCDFDVCELEMFDPLEYVKAIEFADRHGYDVIVIDSLSHAWVGKGGALEQVDRVAMGNKNNTFAAWSKVTPKQNALVDAILSSKAHVIVTMRSKTEFVLESRNGKMVPRKVGMAPVQRDGIDYEFSVVGELDLDHSLTIIKTRHPEIDGQMFERPGRELGERISQLLSDGAPAMAPAPDRSIVTDAPVDRWAETRASYREKAAQALDGLDVQAAKEKAILMMLDTRAFDDDLEAHDTAESVLRTLVGGELRRTRTQPADIETSHVVAALAEFGVALERRRS